MSYTFDATGGDTRAQLVERVLTNSFSASRYGELALTFLDEAVTDICRRLEMQRGFEVLAYDSAGLVTQPASPFFHVEEVWLARAATTGTGEQAFAAAATDRLEPLDHPSPAGLPAGTPIFYTARRGTFTGRRPSLQITVLPASTAGKVAVVGLQRPAPMDDDSDVSGLGADLDRALVAFARGRAFEYEDDFEMADRWSGWGLSVPSRYEQALRDVAHLADQSDGPVVAEGAWPGDC